VFAAVLTCSVAKDPLESSIARTTHASLALEQRMFRSQSSVRFHVADQLGHSQ
jgi:hypothetical protein